MPDRHPEILAHYEVYDEANRLTRDDSVEYLRTTRILARYLSPPPGSVADIGGGPGAYAGWLARRGYHVHLFDLIPGHVEKARRVTDPAWVTTGVADARRLPLPDEAMEAVLLLGPLYHLVDRADRIDALTEAHRILRPGGVLFAAGISKYASAIDGAMRDLIADPGFRRIVEQDLTDGQHRNPTKDPAYFTTAFFHHPTELFEEVTEADFVDAEVLAVEGLGWAVPELEQTLTDPAKRDRLFNILDRLESEPALLGASPHLLAVARRGV